MRSEGNLKALGVSGDGSEEPPLGVPPSPLIRTHIISPQHAVGKPSAG